MESVSNFSQISTFITHIKAFKKGYATNFFLSQQKATHLIAEEKINAITFDQSIFLLRKNDGFSNLYYFSTSLEKLRVDLERLREVIADKTIIVDLVGGEGITVTKELFEEVGFNVYTFLVRMSRTVYQPDFQFKPKENLKLLDLSQTGELLTLFNQYFDPRAEQLPTQADIENWIATNSVMTFMQDGKIIGFIIFEQNGLTLYLRYWFVHPNFRALKIGSELFNYFLYSGKDSKRQLFWVIHTNQDAINKYKHYGFDAEKMYNFVLTNKAIVYEA